MPAAEFYTIATLLLSVMLSIGGILLGMGFALGDKRLKEFGQNELLQTAINGAILGVIFLLFAPHGFVGSVLSGMMSGLSLNATCESMLAGNPAICFASAYLAGASPVVINGIAYQSLLALSTEMLLSVSAAYVAVALISSIKFSFIISISLSALFSPLLSQFSRIISMLTTAIIGIEAQAMLLKFIAATTLTVILPVGMLLRIVYFTRRLGGALMAIAIGLFCVLPLTYVMDATLVSNYSSSANMTAMVSLVSAINSTSQGASSAIPAYSNDSNATGMLHGLSTFATNVSSSLLSMVRKMLNVIALLLIEVFLLPLFSVILTVISIREFARVLGSEFMTQMHLGYL
ncbi:MAG: hypothetical protein QXW10_00125 [Candidatus Micrarchaeaceae archaeon]